MFVTSMYRNKDNHLFDIHNFSVNARSPDDLHRPDILGLKGARNFYINGSDNIILGAWYVK